jgi:hypothetical protein
MGQGQTTPALAADSRPIIKYRRRLRKNQYLSASCFAQRRKVVLLKPGSLENVGKPRFLRFFLFSGT